MRKGILYRKSKVAILEKSKDVKIDEKVKWFKDW